MKLTKKALKAINEPEIRMRIALDVHKSDNTIKRWIKANDDNLTKASALAVIKRETGMPECEILEPVTK